MSREKANKMSEILASTQRHGLMISSQSSRQLIKGEKDITMDHSKLETNQPLRKNNLKAGTCP